LGVTTQFLLEKTTSWLGFQRSLTISSWGHKVLLPELEPRVGCGSRSPDSRVDRSR
jgi:hypothetical protein